MPAGAAADPCETSGEHPAADVAVELALHQPRHHLASSCDGGGEGRAVMTNRAMQGDALDVARAVARRQRRAGLGAARQPAVAARQRRGRDRVHPCTAVSAGGFVRRRCGDLRHSCCPLSSRPAAPVRVAKTERSHESRSRQIMFETLKLKMTRLSEMMQAMSNILNAVHQTAEDAIRSSWSWSSRRRHGDDTTTTNFTNNDVRVSRSVSDVVSKQRQENVECRRQLSSPAAIPDNADQQQQKQLAGRGTFCDRVSS